MQTKKGTGWVTQWRSRRAKQRAEQVQRVTASEQPKAVVDRELVADCCQSTLCSAHLSSLASSAGDRGPARCRRWATSWRRWAEPPPAVVRFVGDTGQLLWRRWQVVGVLQRTLHRRRVLVCDHARIDICPTRRPRPYCSVRPLLAARHGTRRPPALPPRRMETPCCFAEGTGTRSLGGRNRVSEAKRISVRFFDH